MDDVGESSARADHVPVLRERVVAALETVPVGWLVDGTLGRGGHARAILDRRSDLHLLGIDRDRSALTASAEALRPFADRITLVQARFDQMADAVEAHRAHPVTGVLLDLGVSSPQLDDAERGFSYRHEAPLDMRMDQGQKLTAQDVVNAYGQAELATVLRRFGDERFADRIAAAVVAARPVAITTQFAEVVRSAIPAPARRRGGHPAKRSFQAVRIEVNGELDALAAALDEGIRLLVPQGRMAVLTYHSGEDRLVKAAFRTAETGGCTCPPGLPCGCGALSRGRLVRRGAWTPGPGEQAANPRSASARLRVFEKGDGS